MRPAVLAAVAAVVVVLLVLTEQEAAAVVNDTPKLTRPVDGGRTSSPWGSRVDPLTGRAGAFHNGADLAVPVGTPLKAPGAGEVIRVWEDPDNGKAIRVRLADGATVFGFAHLSQQLVSEGEQVAAGQIIGLTGNSGASTGPHVHVAAWVNGQNVNPEPLWS